MVFAYFLALIAMECKFFEGPFTGESQINHPKMCKILVQYSNPLIMDIIVVTLE